MLNNFFDQNKTILQIIGFLMVIAGIFLSVPTPTNITAHTALIHIQMVWFYISVSVISVLLFRIFYWMLTVEIKSATDIFMVAFTIGIILTGFIVFNIDTQVYIISHNGMSENDALYVMTYYFRIANIALYISGILTWYNRQLFRQIGFIESITYPAILNILVMIFGAIVFYLLNAPINIFEFMLLDIKIKIPIFLIHLLVATLTQLQIHRKIQRNAIFRRVSEMVK